MNKLGRPGRTMSRLQAGPVEPSRTVRRSKVSSTQTAGPQERKLGTKLIENTYFNKLQTN